MGPPPAGPSMGAGDHMSGPPHSPHSPPGPPQQSRNRLDPDLMPSPVSNLTRFLHEKVNVLLGKTINAAP